MRKRNKLLDSLDRKREEYNALRVQVESWISPYCEFEAGVEYQMGDGHCLVNVNTENVAPLDKCVLIIGQMGSLTEEGHEKLCI